LLVGIPLLLLGLIIFLNLPWLLLFIGIHSKPNPPHPEITYGEFPFRLEYEINGDRKVIEDTLICEFDGFGADEGRGKYRKWKQRLASGQKNVTLVRVNDSNEIYLFPGSAEYYMGDLDTDRNDSSFPNALYIQKDGRFTSGGIIRADELLSKHHIKLISWNPSQPVKNTFSK
jgi:hypothetical protein